VTDRRGGVDAAADAVGNGDGDSLGFASRVGESVDDWIPRPRQDLCRTLDAFFKRGRLAVDDGDGPFLDMMVKEPRFAENSGVLGLGNVVVLNGQLHVVADAAAKGTGGIRNDFEFGHDKSLSFDGVKGHLTACRFPSPTPI